jgi:hypothetical protein
MKIQTESLPCFLGVAEIISGIYLSDMSTAPLLLGWMAKKAIRVIP